MRSLDEKLEAVAKRFEEVTAELGKPEVVTVNYLVMTPSRPVAGDFGNDGRGDILWRQMGGQLMAWSLSGDAVTASGRLNRPSLPTPTD